MLDAKLQQGIDMLGLSVPAAQQQTLLAYLDLLEKWNKAYNLTAIRDINAMLPNHLLDSLSLLPHIQGQNILDVGTGAGLPGLVLAIVSPDKHFVLLDSNGKKTRFIQQAVHELGINNVEIINDRIENYQPSTLFDSICARAFASLAQLLQYTARLVGSGGVVIQMLAKTDIVTESLPAAFKEQALLQVNLPFTDKTRHLRIISKQHEVKEHG